MAIHEITCGATSAATCASGIGVRDGGMELSTVSRKSCTQGFLLCKGPHFQSVSEAPQPCPREQIPKFRNWGWHSSR